MSERKIGDQFDPGNQNGGDYTVAWRACTGAPKSIQPGAVVALAEALEWCAEALEDKCKDSEAAHHARTALAFYNGTTEQ